MSSRSGAPLIQHRKVYRQKNVHRIQKVNLKKLMTGNKSVGICFVVRCLQTSRGEKTDNGFVRLYRRWQSSAMVGDEDQYTEKTQINKEQPPVPTGCVAK